MIKISEGTSEFHSEIEEVNIFVKELKIKYDKENLKEEVSRINSLITTPEFIKFFCKKRESTESSPSGCHMGLYKVCASDENLADILTAMINIRL